MATLEENVALQARGGAAPVRQQVYGHEHDKGRGALPGTLMDAGPSQRCAAPSHAPPSPPAVLSPSPHAAPGATPAPTPAPLRPAAGANASAVHSSSCVTRAKPPSSTKCASAARLCFSAAPTCRPAAAGACLCCSLLLGVQRR